MISFSLNSTYGVKSIEHILEFLWKHNFLERQKTKMLLRNVQVTFSVYAKHPPLINLAYTRLTILQF